MFDIETKTSEYASIVVTHECNKQCSFCVDKYRGSGEFLTMANLHKALNHASDNRIRDILIVGGEPTLHPNIVEIATVIKKRGFRSILTTNYTHPKTVKDLDGIIDCFNISFYNQQELPRQIHYKSDITIHALIHSMQLSTLRDLDKFIDTYSGFAHLKFSTLFDCNDWANKNSNVSYLDSIDCEWVVLFNEILGQKYRGSTIKRYDRIINNNAKQSIKYHVNGEISKTWERAKAPRLTNDLAATPVSQAPTQMPNDK